VYDAKRLLLSLSGQKPVTEKRGFDFGLFFVNPSFFVLFRYLLWLLRDSIHNFDFGFELHSMTDE
jgi:hypothetical protein